MEHCITRLESSDVQKLYNITISSLSSNKSSLFILHLVIVCFQQEATISTPAMALLLSAVHDLVPRRRGHRSIEDTTLQASADAPLSQTGFTKDQPSYSAMLKWDLDCTGESPEPVRPPYHVHFHLSRSITSQPKSTGSTSQKRAIDYELAGRRDEHGRHTFSDIRSAAIARKRMRTRLDKYYSFKGVNPGQLSADHYQKDAGSWFTFGRTLDDPNLQVVKMTKRTLYNEAQHYPRPPRHHRSCRWDKLWRDIGSRHVQRTEMLELHEGLTPADGENSLADKEDGEYRGWMDVMEAILWQWECKACEPEREMEVEAGDDAVLSVPDCDLPVEMAAWECEEDHERALAFRELLSWEWECEPPEEEVACDLEDDLVVYASGSDDEGGDGDVELQREKSEDSDWEVT